MNNKTIKVAIAALVMMTVGSVRPNSQASGGGVAQTKPITVNCCSTGGMTATSSGTCSCDVTASDTVTATGRARGDVVRLRGVSKGQISMDNAGEIQVPQVGQVYEYQYGKIKLVIGSFSLRDSRLNQKADNVLKGIIAAAAKKAGNEKFNTMIWYGRRLAGSSEVVEIGESLTSATDLANTAVKVQPVDKESFNFTTPENAGGEEFLVDLNPILKQ